MIPLLALALFGFQETKTLTFVSAPGTPDDQLQKAAETLAKRCEGVGFPGITTQVESRENGSRIILTSKASLSKAKQEIIERLGVFKGNSLGLMLTHRLTKEEAKVYTPPKEGEPGKAPDGSRWVPKISEDGAMSWILMRNAPSARPHPKLEIHQNPASGDAETYYLIPAGETAALRSSPLVKKEAALLTIDGMVFDGGGRLDFGAVQFGRPYAQARYHLGFRPQIFDASLRFPMAVTLKRVRE